MSAAATAAHPEGLVYRTGLIGPDEQAELLELLDGLELHEIRMRGQVARRTARHYGIAYDYASRAAGASMAEAIPEWLIGLRTRCARVAELDPEELVECLVQRYPPGGTIGWHVDAPGFGDVVGISLGSPCRLRFQRGRGEERRTAVVELAPGSAYVLRGEARWDWRHSIPPTPGLRYSITFRTLREPAIEGRPP